jgi:hypothetical protein
VNRIVNAVKKPMPMASNSEYEQRKVEADMRRLIKETPEGQKKNGILYVSEDIFNVLKRPVYFDEFPVATSNLIKSGEAFILPNPLFNDCQLQDLDLSNYNQNAPNKNI